jgi:hypothetical protein
VRGHASQEQLAIQKKTGLLKAQVDKVVKETLEEVLHRLLRDLHKWVVTYVPKDTGLLRLEVGRQIDKSELGAYGNEVRLNMGISEAVTPYASYVDAMPTEKGKWWKRVITTTTKTGKKRGQPRRKTVWYQPHVRHHGERGGRSGFLNDPKAIGGFWERLRMHARTRLQVHLKDVLRSKVPPGIYQVFARHLKADTYS